MTTCPAVSKYFAYGFFASGFVELVIISFLATHDRLSTTVLDGFQRSTFLWASVIGTRCKFKKRFQWVNCTCPQSWIRDPAAFDSLTAPSA